MHTEIKTEKIRAAAQPLIDAVEKLWRAGMALDTAARKVAARISLDDEAATDFQMLVYLELNPEFGGRLAQLVKDKIDAGPTRRYRIDVWHWFHGLEVPKYCDDLEDAIETASMLWRHTGTNRAADVSVVDRVTRQIIWQSDDFPEEKGADLPKQPKQTEIPY